MFRHRDFRASLLHELALINLTNKALQQSRFKCPNGLGQGHFCVSCQYFTHQIREAQLLQRYFKYTA